MRSLLFPAALAAVIAAPALAEDSAMHQRKLDNGLDVLVTEKHNAPIVTIEVAVKTGAFTEDRETNGLSHLYEHMFFKGNAAIPTQEAYMKRMQELGIQFNGTTGDERVNYFITLPSKNFAAGMKFMSDALLTPLFNQEELEKERLVVIGEYDRNESSPEYFLHVGVNKAAYGEDFLRKNPLGVREVILRASRETMIGFKNTYYVPNNSLLSIVGDVNETEAAVLVDRLFGPSQWKLAEDPHAAHPRPPIQRLEASKAVIVGRENAAVPAIMTVWNGPDTDRDQHATYVADVWGTLCQMRSGRFQKTFKDGGLSTSASIGYQTQRDGGHIDFHAQLRKEPAEVREALLKELEAMASDQDYWTSEELRVAKNTLRVDRAYEEQSGQNLSHSITYNWAVASIDYYTTYLEETDKVTLPEIRHFVARYLVGRPYVIGYLTSTDDAAKIDEATLLGTPPEQRAAGLAAGVTSFKLENGVRAIYRQDPHAKISALEVFFDGGSAYATKETQGLERFAFAAALEGSKEHPRQEMRKAIEALGARVSHDSTFDLTRVGIQGPTETFWDGAQLLAACLKEPELAARSMDQKRDEIVRGLKRESQSPDALVRKITSAIFYAGTPYENRPEGTEETVANLDEAMCRKAIAQATIPSRMLVVVVSADSQDAVKQALEGLFGWAKAPETEPARTPLAVPAPKERSAFAKRPTATTYIRGQFSTPSPDDPGYPVAKVLMTILHDRLWDAIRTKRALSYAPGAGIGAQRENLGVITASSTDPKKTIEVMLEEMAKLKADLVTASELKAVVAGDVTHRAEQSESSSAHAAALGRAELLQGGWKKLYEETDDLGKVTAEQVRDAARKLLTDVRWGFVGKEPVDKDVYEKSGERPREDDVK